MGIMRKFGYLLNMSTGSAQSIKYYLEVSSILHGDDSELVLLVDPDEESLILVVEDTSAVGPVSIQTYSLKESVSLLEEEVVFDKLLSLFLSQRGEGIVFAVKLALKSCQSLDYLGLNLFSLLFS